MTAWRKECASRIADAITSWPTELCRIVSEFALNDVRWLADRPQIVKITDNGLSAEIIGSVIEYLDGVPFTRVQAERPLKETSDTWTIRYAFNGYCSYGFNIGIVTAANELNLTPRMQFSDGQLRAIVYGNWTWSIPALADRDRFVVSADLRTGRLTVRLRRSIGDKPSEGPVELYTTIVKPAVLSESFPVVYFYGHGTRVRLMND
jgi:hypothetical protein